MGGVVQAFDLHLRALAPNAGAQIENREGGVVDPQPSKPPLWLTEEGEHQTAQDGGGGHHKNGGSALDRMTLDQVLDELARLCL